MQTVTYSVYQQCLNMQFISKKTPRMQMVVKQKRSTQMLMHLDQIKYQTNHWNCVKLSWLKTVLCSRIHLLNFLRAETAFHEEKCSWSHIQHPAGYTNKYLLVLHWNPKKYHWMLFFSNRGKVCSFNWWTQLP